MFYHLCSTLPIQHTIRLQEYVIFIFLFYIYIYSINILEASILETKMKKNKIWCTKISIETYFILLTYKRLETE